MTIKICSERDALHKKIDLWQLLIERNAPMSERLELAQLEEQILRMSRERTIIGQQDTLQYARDVQRFVEVWKENDKQVKGKRKPSE